MIDNKIQVAAINKDLNYKSFTVLIALKDLLYKSSIKNKEIQNLFPIYLNSSSEVKTGIEILQEKGIISCNYNRGVITNLKLNEDEVDEIFSGEKIVKEKKVVKKTPVTNELTEIVDYYNSFPELPRPSTLTQNVKITLNKLLEESNKSDINDAIKYASTQKWLTNKAEEPWCNLLWVLRNIKGFMVGGKYRRFEKKDNENAITKKASSSVIVL